MPSSAPWPPPEPVRYLSGLVWEPEAVPVLEPHNIAPHQHWGDPSGRLTDDAHKWAGIAGNLALWLNQVFFEPATDSGIRRKAVQALVREIRRRDSGWVSRHRLKLNDNRLVIYEGLSLIRSWSRFRAEPEEAAAAWNDAMRALGYTEVSDR